MKEFLVSMSEFGPLIDIISCVFTVLALVFTLYFWLLDNLNEEETKFVEGKDKLLNSLYRCLKIIRSSKKTDKEKVEEVRRVNGQLEVVLNYRFWGRSTKKEEYSRISEFCQDSRYLISTMRRQQDAHRPSDGMNNGVQSLVGVGKLSDEQMSDIWTDYKKGLAYIIDFIENWH